MEENIKYPTIEEVSEFLREYGWGFKKIVLSDGSEAIISNYTLEGTKDNIYITFKIEGEFVIASTDHFLSAVPVKYASAFLNLNDYIKLVKVYSVNSKDSDNLEIEVGFELWGESWNKDTFFAFIDMFCFGIEKTVKMVRQEAIPHEIRLVAYGDKR